MGYCEKCDSNLEDNDMFCAKCGSKIETKEIIKQDGTEKDTQYFEKIYTISKKEYFATKCSKKAKNLLRISWAIWILNIISAIVGIFGNWKVMFGDKTITDVVVHLIKYIKESNFIFIISFATFMTMILSVLALIFGFFSIKKHNTYFAICYLVLFVFSPQVPIIPIFNVICAIFILVVICVANKEYKKYIYGFNKPKGECIDGKI